MKTINVALIGFGSVGQSFARLLLEKKAEIEEKYSTTVNVVAITTKTRGNLVDAWGIDLQRVLNNIEETGVFPKSQETMLQRNSLDVAEAVEYDVLVEMTPLEFATGQMATEHIKAALKRGKSVICANKGPLAWHYRELESLAQEKGGRLLYEATIMGGTPVFSIVRDSLKLCKVTEIKGILNSATNYIMQGIGQGKDVKEIITEGKRRGFIEANPKDDMDGKEAAAKVAVLANTLMGADITPADIDITGIEGITKEKIDDAQSRGNVIKLICRVYEKDGKICGSVAPEEISDLNAYATVTGTSLAISITTDLMGTMTIIEESPETDQTGYGIFADMLTILKLTD